MIRPQLHEISRQGLVEMVRRATRDRKTTPETLTLGLTKSIVIHDYDNAYALESIKELCARSGRFLVGDLGRDHATYSNLKDLADDSVKLSRAFIFKMVQYV